MTTQPLSGAGKRVLCPVVLFCIGTFAVPPDARGQQFQNPVCTVQSVTRGKVTTWHIKGTATVSNLPAHPNSTTVRVKMLFQKKAKGAAKWSEVLDVTLTAKANNGMATIDTDFKDFKDFKKLQQAPAAGDQYRISLSGTWTNPGPPPKEGKLSSIDSLSITPLP